MSVMLAILLSGQRQRELGDGSMRIQEITELPMWADPFLFHYNEEENILKVIQQLENSLKFEHEIIVINDHSTDSTKEIINDLRKDYKNISIVDNKNPKGFANALKTGFGATNSDFIVPVMADLCDDSETINRMYEKINEGFDIVCGSRYMKGGKKIGGPFLKSFFSRFVSISLHILIGLPTHDIANAFKMYRKSIFDNIKVEGKSFEISMEIPLKAYFKDFRITEIPTVWNERKAGKSNFKALKLTPNYLKWYLWAIW